MKAKFSFREKLLVGITIIAITLAFYTNIDNMRRHDYAYRRTKFIFDTVEKARLAKTMAEKVDYLNDLKDFHPRRAKENPGSMLDRIAERCLQLAINQIEMDIEYTKKAQGLIPSTPTAPSIKMTE